MFSKIFKVSYLVVFYFLLSTFTFAQDNWTWLNPKPMGSTILSSGYFPGTNIIIAVGANGLIMRSTDNGSNWSHIQSNITSGFYTVSILNSVLAYVAGENAAILKTTDAGQTWTKVTTTDISDTIAQLQFVSETTGFLRMGNSIYKTVNGGIDWVSIVTNNTGWLTTFYAVADTKLYFGTTSGAYYSASQSGGWAPVFINTFTTESNFRQVKTIVANAGNIAVFSDYEQISLSSDAGITWASPISGNTGMIFACATFISGNDLVAASTAGVIITSVDGGLNWSPASVETSSGVNCISSNSSNNIILLGANGVQYNTSDAGANWSKTSETITSNQLNAVYTIGGTTIWAAGNSGVLIKSTNGGQTWTQKNSTTTNAINDIKFVDQNSGYFVAGSSIYKSIDGGETWSVFKGHSGVLNEISISSENSIMIAASDKKIFYTNNGGASWSTKVAGLTGHHNSVVHLNSTTAFFAGSTNKIFKTVDNGVTWSDSVSATGTINSIWFSSPTTGWAVGNSGLIYKSTNSGGAWSKILDGLTNNHLQSIRFSDSQNGIIVGNLGFVLKTTDGGTTWSRTSQVTDNHLMSAILLDGSTILVVGVNGTIIKSYNAPLPVELTSFTATHKNGTVTLNWETKTEIDNYGFEIERKSPATGWQKIGFVEGHFTTNSPKYYNFTDRPSGTGKIQYRLKQIDNDGSFEYSPVVEVDLSGMLPKEIEIKNFPNPFSTGSPSGNPETNINITIPETSDATVDIYNSTGEKVVTLFTGKLNSGETRAFKLDGTSLPSGMYIVHVSAGKHRKSHKVMLMK